MKNMIAIAISTDERGFEINATLIASIIRRASRPVWVRCWCRGFLPESFATGPLKVEFLPAEEEVTGKYPGASGPAAYDRLRVIRDCPDWDRCVVMDYDQLALCDLAPLMDLDLGEHLLAAHMQGPGVDMAYAMRVWLKRPLPEGWEHVADHPYFLMPPVMNLKAMREAGTWETFLAAHAAFGADEQLSLTAATEGRTLALDRRWNLFPKLHIREDEVPEGVIHWSGWPKPWHRDAKVWRPDIWEAERASWEHLRMGIWQKPLAIEVDPEDGGHIKGLLERGWRVELCCANGIGTKEDGVLAALGLEGFPDLKIHGGGPAAFHRLLRRKTPQADMVRFGAWVDSEEWLAGAPVSPNFLVMRGRMESRELGRLEELGYMSGVRMKSREWPNGGPLPRVLEFSPMDWDVGLAAGEDVYLKRDAGSRGQEAGQLRVLAKPDPETRAESPKKIGVLVAVDAKDLARLGPWLRALRMNFLPGHEVVAHVFTDGECEEAENLRVVRLAETGELELARYKWFAGHREHLADRDYVYHLDLNTRVVDKVGEEIFTPLVGVAHPGYFNKARREFTYETRSQSRACVGEHEGSTYFYGKFQGGERCRFLDACGVMAGWIQADGELGLTARWKDESHWNRYLIDHPPETVLSPAYCCYASGCDGEFEPKVVVVS
jgi:hypothetical protein